MAATRKRSIWLARALLAGVLLTTACSPDASGAGDELPPPLDQATVDRLTADDEPGDADVSPVPGGIDPFAPGSTALPAGVARQMAAASSQTDGAVHIVIDVSGSMSSSLGLAKAALIELVTGLESTVAVGLRSYSGSCGTQRPQPDVPIAMDNDAAIIAGVNGLRTGGGTPTGVAVSAGLEDLAAYSGPGPKRLVVITDGDNQCSTKVCDLVKDALANGTAFTLYAVGIATSSGQTADLQCAADISGGRSVVISTPEEINGVLDDLIDPEVAVWMRAWNPFRDPAKPYLRQPGVIYQKHEVGEYKLWTVPTDAAIQVRAYGTNEPERPRSDLLITETLNIAGAYAPNRDNLGCGTRADGKPANINTSCLDELTEVAPALATLIVQDLVALSDPAAGATKRPMVALLLQEARPVLVEAISAQLASELDTPVHSVFATTASGVGGSRSAPLDLDALNAVGIQDPKGCDAPYTCEYGNAIVATTPLAPAAAVRFAHLIAGLEIENRVGLVVNAIAPDGQIIGLATTHLQDAKGGKDATGLPRGDGKLHRAGELALLRWTLADTLSPRAVVGGDFNDKELQLHEDPMKATDAPGLFLSEKSTEGQIDKLFDRLLVRVRLGGPVHNPLDSEDPEISILPHDYVIDHPNGRMASCWSLDVRQIFEQRPSSGDRCASRREIP